jgi:soluble lytic murein transglycosylase-like protein
MTSIISPRIRRALMRGAAVAFIGTAAVVVWASSAPVKAAESPLEFLLNKARIDAPPVGKTRMKKRIRSSKVKLQKRVSVSKGSASGEAASQALRLGVPVRLALAVCQVESGCRHGLTGAAGEKGAFQIKPATARMLGYSGPASALSGSTGLYWGMRHLALAWRGCGTFAGAAKRHNAGLGASCKGSGYSAKVVRLAGGV